MGHPGNRVKQKPSKLKSDLGHLPYLAISLTLKIATLLRKDWFKTEIMRLTWHQYGIPSHLIGRH